MLAARLATNRLEENWRQNTVAVNLAKCEPRVSEAHRLWRVCKYLFDKTPKTDRRGLSVDECALLAAELVHGQPMREIDLRIVASSALQLWQKCKQRLTPNRELHRAFQAALESVENEETKDKPPAKFPVSVRAATKGWLPESRWPNRSSWFRHFLRDSFRFALPPDVDTGSGFLKPVERSPEECEQLGDKEFQRLMQKRLNEREYHHYRFQFPRWLREHQARARTEKAAKGGRMKELKAVSKAAEAGDAVAQNKLGIIYGQGDGVPKDCAEAAKWFAKAAEQGFPHALYNLGLLYHKGLGVPRDPAKAKRCWEKAQAHGGGKAATQPARMRE